MLYYNLKHSKKEGSVSSRAVASVPMGLGGQLPPHFLEKSTKSQTFLSVFTVELLWITLKSHADLVSAPPLFSENDAPGSTPLKLEWQIIVAANQGSTVQSSSPDRINWGLCWKANLSCAISALRLIAVFVPMSIRHLLWWKWHWNLSSIHQASKPQKT